MESYLYIKNNNHSTYENTLNRYLFSFLINFIKMKQAEMSCKLKTSENTELH